MEKFKVSEKSLCHTCTNVDEVCDMKVHMSCGNDSKAGVSFVQKCASYNKPIGESVDGGKSISVGHKADSRVEMMGGGHAEPGE